ncbi:MAG: PfkB family carbohydrate kinase [Actinomycetota bacterium]|nr:PfkB family carbohydrate kinase [Actinomycetota bacterium]
MPVTVVGSIAFDAVRTPAGERARMLGGAATHFALAASFFTEVRVVGVVGEDFGEGDLEILGTRGTTTDDVERVAGGRTFFWSGAYREDLNVRDTLDTQLNVFADFKPRLSEAARRSETLFLANIVPAVQREVREQCDGARFVALDSMDLWIATARDDLVDVLRSVDCLLLNDEEIEMLTGEPTVLAAAHRLLSWGPRVVVAKQGKYGAGLITQEGSFWLPAFPLHRVVDPTGAGDTFAGGFVGFLDAHRDEEVTLDLLRRAMAYGSAIASFNVEAFGTERVVGLTGEEIAARVEELGRITRFEDRPVRLRA